MMARAREVAREIADTHVEEWVGARGENPKQVSTLAHAIESALNLFAQEAVAGEREACAKVAEECDTLGPGFEDDELTNEGRVARKKVRQIASAIRDRTTGEAGR